MADRGKQSPGSWLMAEEYYERGDAAFVDELRRVDSPERLGGFAKRWLEDGRPASRTLLLEYLDRPLNAFRHEPLIKRLFKLAGERGDDEVMGAMLVALDRSIRRERKKIQHFDWRTEEHWTEESIVQPIATMPRDRKYFRYSDPVTGQRLAASTPAKHARLRLFSLPTRRYLRRRAWRYFRALGKSDPARYRTAIVAALARYHDDDVRDGLALLDNWGLVHALFHHSPVVRSTAMGWQVSAGRRLDELQPAPMFPEVWTGFPDASIGDAGPLLTLLCDARAFTVRHWALAMLRQHHLAALSRLPLGRLIEFVTHSDPEVARLGVDSLRDCSEIDSLSAEQWLETLDRVQPPILDPLCALMAARLDPNNFTPAQLVNLSAARPVPVARMGFAWLRGRWSDTPEECAGLLSLSEAQSEPVRPEIVRWVCEVLGASPHFSLPWILEILDSRHADVREVGWNWLLKEPRAGDDVAIWQKLLESPYDDMRLRMVTMLEGRTAESFDGAAKPGPARLEPALVRFLWACVLLNIHRGGGEKSRVVKQITDRLQHRPQDFVTLLPLLAVAIRSVRGPEFRHGLMALVQLVEWRPELVPTIEEHFPELSLQITAVPGE